MPAIGKYEFIKADKLVLADWNYKTDDPIILKKLTENLKRNGQIENIIVRELETGFYEVVNGNHRVKACWQLEYEDIFCFNLGKISLPHAQRIAIETNETRFASDTDKLLALIDEIKLEFNEEDLNLTIPDMCFDIPVDTESFPRIVESADVDQDEATLEPPKDIFTRTGDIYEFVSGHLRHRLLCGDSTDNGNVLLLMDGKKAHMLHTDPPYNVKYPALVESRSDGAIDCEQDYRTEWTDDMPDDEYAQFLVKVLANAKSVLIEHAHYYVWFASRYQEFNLNAFRANDIPVYEVPIIWVKQTFAFGRSHYKQMYEPCLYGGKFAITPNGTGARWFGPDNERTVWEYPRDFTGHYVHPTQKPLFLPARAIRNSSKGMENVLDLFGGSGSTLIACDQLLRNNYSMELSPGFCDVIATRFAKYKSAKSEPFSITRNGEDVTPHFISMISTIDLKEKDIQAMSNSNDLGGFNA